MQMYDSREETLKSKLRIHSLTCETNTKKDHVKVFALRILSDKLEVREFVTFKKYMFASTTFSININKTAFIF